MRAGRVQIRLAMATVIMGLTLATARAQEADRLAGLWQGTLQAGATPLRLVLKVKATSAGHVATLDSVDQGAKDLKVDAISLGGQTVQFAMRQLGASYRGTLSADGKTITGTFSQGGANLPLTFERSDKTPQLDRPQHPRPPFPYRAVDVAWSHDPARPVADGFQPKATRDDKTRVTLAGTLTLPRGPGPHPAAVLISGSGQQNRDEELMGHKPFLVLADHLTRLGIAVLRYDDRAVGGSVGPIKTATSADFARDAASALQYLRTRSEIDHGKLGVIGHSEGGLIAPLVAGLDPKLAFAVLLAGPGVRGDALLTLQQALILRASGVPEPMVAKLNAIQAKLTRRIAEGKPETLNADLRPLLIASWNALMPAQRQAMKNDREAFIKQQVAQVANPWMRYFLAYDPAPALQKMTCPVLALNGGKDLQVDARQNLPAIKQALEAGGNGDVETVELPGLNHLFQTCTTGAPAEYARITETFSPTALKRISDWLRKRFVKAD